MNNFFLISKLGLFIFLPIFVRGINGFQKEKNKLGVLPNNNLFLNCFVSFKFFE